MNKAAVSIIILLFIICAGFYWLFFLQNSLDEEDGVTDYKTCVLAGNPTLKTYPQKCISKDGRTFKEDVESGDNVKSNLIRVFEPVENAKVESPLIIKGEARGYWFFEASFPIRLEDLDGNVLSSGIATAKSDWMTEDFVPFEATLSFEKGTSTSGKLILMKDNPSGLIEHDNSIELGVIF